MARYCGRHAQYVRDLFGTDTLPTTFTDRVPAEHVIAFLQSNNYGCDVVAEGNCGRP